MKQEIFLKREQQSRKEWLPGGKHSGSLVIPSGQEEILRAGEVDIPGVRPGGAGERQDPGRGPGDQSV